MIDCAAMERPRGGLDRHQLGSRSRWALLGLHMAFGRSIKSLDRRWTTMVTFAALRGGESPSKFTNLEPLTTDPDELNWLATATRTSA